MTNKTTHPVKLVVLVQDLEFGGTQRYAIHLLSHLDRALFDPELWVFRHGPDMIPLAHEAGIKTVLLSGSSWVSPRSIVNLFRKLLSSRPQILYTLTATPNIWGRIFGRMMRVPAVVSGYRSLLPGQHEQWLWPLANRIICNAEALRDVMTSRFSVAPNRIAVVPNAVDTDYFSPADRCEAAVPTVLYAGRLVNDKDPLNLLEGFRLAAERIPAARLEIMGNGPLAAEVERRVAAHRLGSNVRVHPAEKDIRPALNRAWVFALGSAQEASPNVIIEAMANGLPVVATHVGGIPELVAHGSTGLLVPPHDPEALADALVELLTDRERRRVMGIEGRNRVLANHTMDRMVRHTERVLMDAFEEAASHHSGARSLAGL